MRDDCSASFPSRTSPTHRSARTTTRRRRSREKTTDGFDAKINYTLNQNDSLSYRLSFMRPVVFDPGLYGAVRRPGQRRLRRQGTNNSFSSAATWTRVFSSTTGHGRPWRVELLQQRHDHRGHGLTTSTDVGIPGANLDDYTSGMSQSTSMGTPVRCWGSRQASPWDRSEKTWNFATTVTNLSAQLTRSSSAANGGTTATCCCRRRTRAGRAASSRSTRRHGPAERVRDAHRRGQPHGVVPARLAEQRERDLKVIDEPGTKHWATSLFIQDKWQARPNITIDLGLRWEYYSPLTGLAGYGQPRELRPGHQHDSRRRLGTIDNAVNVEKNFTNFNAANGRVVASEQRDGHACRLRREHDSLPG